MKRQAPRHHLSDWLELHELSPAICRSLLAAMPAPAGTSVLPGNEESPDRSTTDLETAWRLTVEAMRAFFPMQGAMIDLTFDKTQRMLVSRHLGSRKAATINNGPGAYPTILYSFLGEPADLMVLSHEFAHALQIRASDGRFVSPVMREICAFVGEQALLAHMAARDAAQYDRLCQIWYTDNLKYFATGRARLDAALSQSDPAYRYAWNYPIARYLAITAQKQLTLDRLWTLFEGHMTVAGILKTLDLKIP